MITRKLREGKGQELYQRYVRPVLFSFSDPEYSHAIAGFSLKTKYPMNFLAPYSETGKERLSFTLEGRFGAKVELGGPIGLAAGFDKNATMLPGLSQLFDYITAGTVLPYKWDGNIKRAVNQLDGTVDKTTRRIVRLEDTEGLLNCLGFPTDGPLEVLDRIKKYTGTKPISLSIAVRPVPGEDQSKAVEQFEWLLEQVAPLIPNKIKMIEINFASPNTDGLAILFEKHNFDVLTRLMTSNRQFNNAILLLKMPPHNDEAAKRRNLDLVARFMQLGGDGITCINTLKTSDKRLSKGVGGSSGIPIYPLLVSNVKDYRLAFGNSIIINATGGITPDKVPKIIMNQELRVDTIQLLTPFIYEGPSIVGDSKVALINSLDQACYKNIQDLRNHLRIN
jgi:dihydroorotate dehydrogenase